MDLRSVLNSSDTADRDRERERERERDRASKAPPTPQQQPHPIQPQRSPAQYPYRNDFGGHPPHQSPGAPGGRPPPQDYPPPPHHAPHHPQQQPPPQPPASAYPQSPYQAPGPYPNRPAPPPLQPANSFHGVPSPGGPMPAPSPTAYRQPQTPTAAPVGTPGGYPFPPSHPPQEMTSPSMRHQPYPPGAYPPQQPQRQDSYSQGPPPYAPQHGPVPQTPVGAGGYIHQRSQSTHSTPTPTSAHSQGQYGPPYHGSPVASSHPLPPNAEYNRQPSQPPTPLGPPLPAGQRQSTGSMPYAPQQQPQQHIQPPLSQQQQQQQQLLQQQQQQQQQQQPSSPYQKRMLSASGHVTIQPSPPLVHTQKPPQQSVPQQPPPVQRIYESPVAENRLRQTSHNEREHSMSVSPKTRVPSLPSNADRTSFSKDIDSQLLYRTSTEPMAIDNEVAATPAKRKLADRDLSPRELERKESRPPPGDVNGKHVPSRRSSPALVKKEAPSPATPAPTHKPSRYRAEEPPWAKNIRTLGKQPPAHPNFVLQKRVHSHLNGGSNQSWNKSRHASPEAVKPNSNRASQAGPFLVPESGPQDLLGPWEASITGVKPYEEASKAVADFLFLNVVNNPDMQEITSRGIKFEIEAKLGTLIDKDTNHRVDRHLSTEAILGDSGRTAFRSSMTEAHHKSFNDYLNRMVIETDPRNPSSGGKRVQVHYKHRREIDRFVDLPSDLQVHLPGAMRHLLGRKNVRARITYDQKTREVLNKIVKARVADIDLHLPACPMDCRLSVNLEMDWDGPVEELEQLAASRGGDRQPDRIKDRLSYTQGHYQIDLTQVTQQNSGPGGQARTDKEHELEIELAPGILVDQGRRAMEGGTHRYQELVEGLVDNVRVLARKAMEF